LLRRHPSSTLFPYTTLFRSLELRAASLPRPIPGRLGRQPAHEGHGGGQNRAGGGAHTHSGGGPGLPHYHPFREGSAHSGTGRGGDRKSTRLNSSHVKISYAV